MRHQAAWLSILLGLAAMGMRPPVTITFEEPIPAPEDVVLQYCNLGVEFPGHLRIISPAIGTSSPPNAATNDFIGNEFGNLDEVTVKFTRGQSEVSVNVGLDRQYQSAQSGTAQLFAYDTDDPATGNQIVSDTVALDTGPTPITRTLQVFSFDSSIRSVRIKFGVDVATAAYEVIDDLTFSVAGPPCGSSDSDPPTVTIAEPLDGSAIYNPETMLRFTTTDDLRVAQVRVAFLDAADVELDGFFRCGGGGLPCPTAPSFESNFHTSLPAGTAKIRVTATDFFGGSGTDEVTAGLVLPGPDYNVWAEALEITQATQPWLPVNTTTRSVSTPTFDYPDVELGYEAVPLVAGRTTIVRLIAGVEDTAGDVPAGRITGSLRCFTTSERVQSCPGAPGPIFPESKPPVSLTSITVDPADTADTRRRDTTKTLNFVLPRSWVDQEPTDPGGEWFEIFLEGRVQAPFGMPECAGCDDAANTIRVWSVRFHEVPDFSETLVRQVRVTRRSLNNDDARFTPAVAHVAGFIDYLRRTLPVDERTISGTPETVLIEQDDGNNVVCDPQPLEQAFPKAADGWCCADGYRVVSAYWGGDLDGMGGDDCPAGGRASGGFARVTVNGPLGPGAWPTMAHEIGHATGAQAASPRGSLPHAGPPPGHFNECKGTCSVTCSEGGLADCNCNGIDDAIDIMNDTLTDANGDNAPDECICFQDSDCTIGNGPCNVGCERDWPWAGGTTGGFGFNLDGWEIIPGDKLPCLVPGVCDNGVDDDNDGLIDEDCVGASPTQTDYMNSPHDFMSYGGCGIRWISPRTWTRIFNTFTDRALSYPTSGAAAASPGGAGADGSGARARQTAASLMVAGTLDALGGFALGPAFELDAAPPGSAEGVGAYRIELRDAQDQTLAARNFDLPETSDAELDEVEHFNEILPLPPGVDTIVLLAGAQTVAQRSRSASAPVVGLLSPDAAGFEGQPMAPLVRWSASDGDGDPLSFIVQYTPGGGAPWRALGSGLLGSTLPVTLGDLAGSTTALVRVLASDGLNTTTAVSPAFIVAGNDPRVEILEPLAGARLLPGERFVARGVGFDTEDGVLDDTAFVWMSDIDGALGGGTDVDLCDLSPGRHVLTLEATDSNGQVGTATVGVDVEEPVNRQPLADAGPDLIAGTVAMLDGTASSDPDGDPLFYSWSLVGQPPGFTASFNSAEVADPWLVADAPGIYEVELIVDDGEVESYADRQIVQFCTDDDADRSCADLVANVDCDDGDPTVFPGAPERNDGRDQNCPGDTGYGLIDEISGLALFGPGAFNTVDKEQFRWNGQIGATLYHVVRSDRPDFVGDCARVTTSDTRWVDREVPPAGVTYYYMVRAAWPNEGPWGLDSSAALRTPVCNDTYHELVFRDRGDDDLHAFALTNMASAIEATTADHILVRVRERADGQPGWEHARCMERADWYVDKLSRDLMGQYTYPSGNWSKWWTAPAGDWLGPDNGSYLNRYGPNCAGLNSWCVEDQLGSMGVLSIRPGDTGICEAYFSFLGGCGNGNWQMSIVVAGDRARTCGF